jgi:hypothetical protein
VARAVLILLAVGWLAGGAGAAPGGRARVVLADPDPELRHAMEHALAPWRLEVVIDGAPPDDAATAEQRAAADTARFVVWRERDQLVVYDRELGSTERRGSRAGALDPRTAAAAALSIKTMMRLPPPPEAAAASIEAEAAPTGPTPAASRTLRVQAALAARLTFGDATDAMPRISGTAQIRPWPTTGWWLGVTADGGGAIAIDRAGFKGTWGDWAVRSVVSWSLERGAWQVEPHALLGVRGSVLDGTETAAARHESTIVPTVGGGLAARWRWAGWTIGATLDVDDSFATPTYRKTDTPAEIFQVPTIGLELAALGAFAW